MIACDADQIKGKLTGDLTEGRTKRPEAWRRSPIRNDSLQGDDVHAGCYTT